MIPAGVAVAKSISNAIAQMMKKWRDSDSRDIRCQTMRL